MLKKKNLKIKSSQNKKFSKEKNVKKKDLEIKN